jgi:hypothetical protein
MDAKSNYRLRLVTGSVLINLLALFQIILLFMAFRGDPLLMWIAFLAFFFTIPMAFLVWRVLLIWFPDPAENK